MFKSMDNSDVIRLEREVKAMLEVIQSLKEKYPNEEKSTPWAPFFRDGVEFPNSVRLIKSGSTVLLEAEPSLANHIDQRKFYQSRRGGKAKSSAVLLKVPFLTDVEKHWKVLHGMDLESIQPSPLPLDSFDKRDNSAPPWIICKVTILEGTYVRFHLSKAWSACVIGTDAGRSMLEREVTRVSAWKLKVGCLNEVRVPMKVSYSWGKNNDTNTLRFNLPSWWKWFGRSGGKRKNNPTLFTLSQSRMGNKMVGGVILGNSRCSRRSGLFRHMKKIRGNKGDKEEKFLEMLASINRPE